MINNVSECLICLEQCKDVITFDCCGEYVIHNKCYNKWKETNKTCLICRNPITENTNFVIYYVNLARIKIFLSCYCLIMCFSILYIIIICDFNFKKDYCDLL